MASGIEEATTRKPQLKQLESIPTIHAGVAIALALSFALIGLYTYGRSSPLLLDHFTRFSAGFASSLPDYTASDVATSTQSGKLSRHDNFEEHQRPLQPNQLQFDQPSAGGQLLTGGELVNGVAVPPRDPHVGLPTVADSSPVSGDTTASLSILTSSSDSTASEAADSPATAVPVVTPSAPVSPFPQPSVEHPPLTNPTTNAPTSPPTNLPTDPPTNAATNPPLSEPPPSLWTRIPGSMLDSPDKIRFFRERFDCIGREGNWSHYVSPRLLPWPDEMSKCDVGHLKKSTRHVAFQDADRMVGQFQEVVTQIAEISKMGRGAPLHLLNQLRQLKRRRDELIRQWTVRDTLKYFWLVPGSSMDGQDGAAASDGSSTNASSCAGPWEWFDPAKFCRILDKRSVLIVGDSINMLLADAIRFNVRLGAKDWDSRVQWGEPTGYCQRYRNATKEPADKRCWTLHLCADLGFSVRVFFVRDYYLNSTEAENDFMVDKSFGETWMDEIAAQGVSVVVMNRGAHFIADEQFERQMKSTLLALRKSYPDLLIIVRNTPAGHPHCWLHRKPLSGKLLDLPHDDWHWDGFAAQNEILKNLTEGVGGVYMDVNASAVWRADGHVGRWDCLHYCHPGPVDTWVQLLFNMLLGLLVPTS